MNSVPRNEIAIEESILDIGQQIFKESTKTSYPFLSKEYLSEKMIEWATQHEKLSKGLFKLVEVLPSLKNAKAVSDHLEEYLGPALKEEGGLPFWMKMGMKKMPIPFWSHTQAWVIHQQVKAMAGRFILGESPEKAIPLLKSIRRKGMAFSLDLLGEFVMSDEDATGHMKTYIDCIQILSESFSGTPEACSLIKGHIMEDSPLHISMKLSAIYPRIDPVQKQKIIPKLVERLSEILSYAKKTNCFITIDMEDYALKDMTLEVVEKVFLQKEFQDFYKVGIVLQAYLKETEKDLLRVLDWVSKRESPITIRLVKGAYWDYEKKLANSNNWPIPVWQKKVSSDAYYEKLTRLLLDNHGRVIPAFASHNIRSLCQAICYAEHMEISKNEFELQGLLGMADPIKAAFVKRGYLVREYVPVGSLLPGMAYFVRRLIENTSNQGFLRLKFYDHESPEKLLEKPISNETEN